MQFIASMKLDRSSIGVEQCDPAAVLNEERLIALELVDDDSRPRSVLFALSLIW